VVSGFVGQRGNDTRIVQETVERQRFCSATLWPWPRKSRTVEWVLSPLNLVSGHRVYRAGQAASAVADEGVQLVGGAAGLTRSAKGLLRRRNSHSPAPRRGGPRLRESRTAAMSGSAPFRRIFCQICHLRVTPDRGPVDGSSTRAAS
jgi:hypothetical protein